MDAHKEFVTVRDVTDVYNVPNLLNASFVRATNLFRTTRLVGE